jgi:hypothetical protein
MNPIFISCFCISIALIGCNSHVRHEVAEVPIELQESITSKLESVALDFLKSWEPPYDPEAALALFTQKEDCALPWFT